MTLLLLLGSCVDYYPIATFESQPNVGLPKKNGPNAITNE